MDQPGGTESGIDRRSRRLWTAAVLLFVALSGLGMQMRGALLPTLGTQWGVSDSLLGLVGPAGTLGYVVTVLAVGAVAGRVDTRRYFLLGMGVIVVGIVGMGFSPVVGSSSQWHAILGIVGMGFSPLFFAYLGFLLLRGLGTGAVRALDRPLLSHYYPHARGRVFNLYDLAWAVGAAAGPALMSVAIANGNWRLAYYGLAVAFVVLLAFIWVLDAPADGDETPLDITAALDLLRTPAIAAMAAALIFHTGLEGGMFIWLPTFGHRVAGFGTETANYLLSAFVLAYIPGRLIYTFIADRVGYGPLIVGLELLIVPTFLWTFFVADGLAVFAGVVVLGALVSGLFPTLVAFGTQAAPEYSAPINAIGMATGSLSMAMVPWLLGVFTQDYGIQQAMWLPLALTLGVAPVVLLARRVDPNI
ncbi:MAG: sugar MFS transporter [Halapricum sp.]